jgi:hypothetical protein
MLFVDTPPSSLSFIYRSLGALHSLQPTPDDEGYGTPTIPALKQRGFVTWQTVQILLGPEEHVPFLQKAVALFDIFDPETGTMFPKILPKECFPDHPDQAMEKWYDEVAQRLKKEAEDDMSEKMGIPRVRVEVDDPVPRTSSELSGEGSADERHGAARYFEDPLYRKRPPIARHFSKQPAFTKQPKAYVEERGRLVASSVRHMLNPFNRRKNMSGRHEDDYSDEDATPIATAPPPVSRYVSHKRPHPPRREDSLSTTDSESDSDGPPSRHRTPVLRHRRSHDPPTSPPDYFPKYHEERRYSHEAPPDDRSLKPDPLAPVFGPSRSPMFATHVAQLQAHNYYADRRPAMPARGSYRTSGSPHVRHVAIPRVEAELPYVREHEAPYPRERERERDRDRDRDRDRGRDDSRSHHRRRSEERPKERDRDRDREGRERSESGRTTRSHDRVKDEWDERERGDKSRDRDRGDRDRGDRDRGDRDRGDRDRGDRDRGDRERARDRTHRYVSAAQDGVGGRRYPPVEQPWRP